MSVPPVLQTRTGAVAEVTLNRPEARNGLDRALKDALVETLAEVAADAEVRAVVLTGAGPAFCVGQDLREHAASLAAGTWSTERTVERHYNPITTAIATMPKPVVAAVNGACVGAGLGFALAADLRVLSSDAVLGTAFTGVGLTCDSGVSATLAQAVGASRARELVLLGTTFDATTAVSWGISGEVVAPAEVLATARGLAARLASGPTLAYAASKRLLAEAPGRPLADVLAAEAREQSALGDTADHREAVEAFLARRTPEFQAR